MTTTSASLWRTQRIWAASVAALFILVSAGACPPAVARAASGADAPLSVVVTIKPIHALTAAVLGDLGKAELLLDGAASPHTYALKPSQVRQLNKADAVVMVSTALETFMAKVISSLPRAVTVVKIDQADGLERLPIREGGLFEEHDHASGGAKHGHGHAHRHEGKSRTPTGDRGHRDSDEAIDAHLWLDPQNAKTIVAHITTSLAKLRPAFRPALEKNAAAVTARLDALQDTIARDLQSVQSKPFIVFHDAYQYFERRFGVLAAGSITLNPDVQPGARRLKELRGRLQVGGAVCVFAEPQFEPKIVETLIQGTKIRRGVLDPIGISITPGPDAYETLLVNMARAMRACLDGTS